MARVGEWQDRWRRLPVAVRDGAVALVVTGLGQLELVLADGVEGSRPLQHLAFFLMTSCLVLRRVRPVTGAVVGSSGLVWQTLLGSAEVASGFVALIVVCYSVATYVVSRRRSLLGLLALLAGILMYPLVEQTKVVDEVVNAMIPTSVWLLARVARERLDRAVRAERAALLQQRSEDERRAAALAAERRRIARELHDVVAHGVTLMLLQTEVLRGSPSMTPDVERHVDVAQDAGRRCLEDLRTLLLVLREDALDADADSDRTDVTQLVEQARAAGADVQLTVDPDLPPLPAAPGVAVYRLVQEALTNAARHAPGAPVHVRLSCRHGRVEVEVENAAAPAGAQTGSGAQLGLVGVRERLALHGGRVDAAPAPGGGWLVRGELPLQVPALT
jgi:signal transduction histidine kinase